MVIFSTAVQCANRQVPILIRLTTSSSPEENDSILLSFFFFLSLHTCTIIDGLLVSVVCTISLLSQRALSFSAAPIYPTTQFLRSATFTKGKFYLKKKPYTRHLPRIINKRFFFIILLFISSNNWNENERLKLVFGVCTCCSNHCGAKTSF